jgi:hypothetical protein
VVDPCAGKAVYRKLLVFISILIFVARNHAVSEQAGKIVGVLGVAREYRLGHMEDFPHGAQIRRVREKDRAGKRKTVHVRVSERRNHDLEHGLRDGVPPSLSSFQRMIAPWSW